MASSTIETRFKTHVVLFLQKYITGNGRNCLVELLASSSNFGMRIDHKCSCYSVLIMSVDLIVAITINISLETYFTVFISVYGWINYSKYLKGKLSKALILDFLSAIAVFGLALSISLGSVVASRNLHSSLLSNVFRCPTSFFDTTPLGRVVNRFSKDVDILDSNIPQFTQNLLITFAPLVSTIIVVCYSTPIFVAIIIPLLILFVSIQVKVHLLHSHLTVLIFSVLDVV